MKTYVVEMTAHGLSDTELAYRLRTSNPAVVGRLRDGKLVLDLRTVFPQQEDALLSAVGRTVTPEST